MVSARRFVVYIPYPGSRQHVTDAFAPHILFRAYAHKQGMHLLVESIGIGKHSVVYCLDIRLRRQKDGSAERSDISEPVQICQSRFKSLVSAPRKACHRTVVPVCQRTESLVDIGDNVVQQNGSERSAQFP